MMAPWRFCHTAALESVRLPPVVSILPALLTVPPETCKSTGESN